MQFMSMNGIVPSQMCYALSDHKANDPFLFLRQTVNSANYMRMLQLFAVLHLACLQPNNFFQQDSTSPQWTHGETTSELDTSLA